jgi:hypothetical protein
MLAAQHAPMGAKICTTSASRITGKNLFNWRRIANPSASELTTVRVQSRDRFPELCCSFKEESWRKPMRFAAFGGRSTRIPSAGRIETKSTTAGGNYSIISQTAGILNNRC